MLKPLWVKPTVNNLRYRMRIQNMKSQICITRTPDLLPYGIPSPPLCGYALDFLLGLFDISSKILPDNTEKDSATVKAVPDCFKICGSLVVYRSDHEGHLIVLFFAHFGAAPFLILVVGFNMGHNFITTR